MREEGLHIEHIQTHLDSQTHAKRTTKIAKNYQNPTVARANKGEEAIVDRTQRNV